MFYKFLLQIESEYGLLQPLSFDHIHNGPDNDVYIVTDGGGYKYILREGKRVGKKVSFELDVLAKLSQANFSSPKPIQTNSGAYSISIDNTQLVLFEYIQGEQIAKILPEHFKIDIIERGGRKFGELHTLTNNMQMATLPIRNVFTEYERFLKLDINTLKHFSDYETLAEHIKTFYSEAKSRISAGGELYGVIHNDYRIQNTLYTKDDVYIIDFDWACYGPLLKDLGLAITEWSTGMFSSPIEINKFLKGYNETAPRKVEYDKDLIFWICFACLSDTCTFITDTAQNNFKYGENVINDVNQCYMYKKFMHFYQELK